MTAWPLRPGEWRPPGRGPEKRENERWGRQWLEGEREGSVRDKKAQWRLDNPHKDDTPFGACESADAEKALCAETRATGIIAGVSQGAMLRGLLTEEGVDVFQVYRRPRFDFEF